MPPPTFTFRGNYKCHDPFPKEGISFNFHVLSPSGQSQIRFSTFHRDQISALQPNQKVAVTFELTGKIMDGHCNNYLDAIEIEAVSWAGNVQNPPYQLTGIVHSIEYRQHDVKIVVQHGEDHFNHFRISSDHNFSLPKVGNSVSLKFELSSYVYNTKHQVFLKITHIAAL